MKFFNLSLTFLSLFLATAVFAGNPDRQGEAGAYELLLNPWARSAGLHSLNTASISGVESMAINVAGVARGYNRFQVSMGHTQYVADTRINALGFVSKLGKNGGAFGVSLTSVDFGDLYATTEENPEGTGALINPSFVTFGLSYGHQFENKVSIGLGVKFVNESISDVSASGFAIDAGVQYVAGEDDRFKFGIALRNVGTRMIFRGEGLSRALTAPQTETNFAHTYYQRAADFELPSQLNMGVSYDIPFGNVTKLTCLGSFVANAFSRDQVGVGVDFKFNEYFGLRAGYKAEMNSSTTTRIESSFDNGFSGGVSGSFKPSRESKTRIQLDYAYRSTRVFSGMHNIGLTASF